MPDDEITAEMKPSALRTESVPAPRAMTRLTVGAGTDMGRVRVNNEDKYVSLEPEKPDVLSFRGRFYAVADGMGGHHAGQIASEIALKTVARSFYSNNDGDPQTALLDAVRTANSLVYETGRRTAECKGMGTTLTAAVIHGSRALFAQVGDSRAYLLRNDRIRQVTHDHSWVAEQVRAGVMSEDEAYHSPYRNVITRSIGAEERVTPDIFAEALEPGDRILLCSDGLSGVVTEEEMEGILLLHPPSIAAWRLIDLANDHGGPDNITALILRVDAIIEDPAEEGETRPEARATDPADPPIESAIPASSIGAARTSPIGASEGVEAVRDTLSTSPSGERGKPRRKGWFRRA